MSSDEDHTDKESPGSSKRQKIRYQQNYNSNWERQFNWIAEIFIFTANAAEKIMLGELQRSQGMNKVKSTRINQNP